MYFPPHSCSIRARTRSQSIDAQCEWVHRPLDRQNGVIVWVKVSLVVIELLATEARIVIAAVETYLKYAEAIGLTAPSAAPRH